MSNKSRSVAKAIFGNTSSKRAKGSVAESEEGGGERGQGVGPARRRLNAIAKWGSGNGFNDCDCQTVAAIWHNICGSHTRRQATRGQRAAEGASSGEEKSFVARERAIELQLSKAKRSDPQRNSKHANYLN